MPQEPMIQLAEEPEQIGRILIGKYHPHLANAKILYLFTDKTRKKCDMVKLGTAAKMNSLQRFLSSSFESVTSGPDFYLLFDIKIWPNLTEKQQRALVDHEVLHCCVYVKSGLQWKRLLEDENIEDYVEWKYGMRAHSFEEFYEVIERYGFWRDNEYEQKFAEAVKQLTLPGLAIQAQSRN